MAKARVYELAKELGVGNKEILEQLKKKNVEVKNHMSTVEDNVAEEIRRENAGRNEEPAKAEPAAEKAGEKDGGTRNGGPSARRARKDTAARCRVLASIAF